MTEPFDVIAYVHEPHEDLARFRAPLERAGFHQSGTNGDLYLYELLVNAPSRPAQTP